MGELQNSTSEKKGSPFLRQAFVTASVSTNIIAHGCVIGLSAILIPSLRLPQSQIHATPSEESWIASIIGFGLIAGNIIITPLMDILGRKKSHLLTILPVLAGWFLLLLVKNVAGLIAARFPQELAIRDIRQRRSDRQSSEANANVIMVALDIERLICNLLAVYLMKTMNRRTLLFSTGAICILSYVAKGLYVQAKQNDKLPFDNQWVPIALIGIYMFSLTVGISSIPFALSGEIFPLEYRGLGSGISILGLSLNFFVALKCFPVLTTAIGLPCTYYLYAGVVTLCLSIVWFMLPETKGRTLQEIEDSFRGLSAGDKSLEPLNKQNGEMMRRVSSVIIY